MVATAEVTVTMDVGVIVDISDGNGKSSSKLKPERGMDMKFTEESCINSVPGVLIDYLWELIAEDDAYSQVFVLKPRCLGDREVQDITVFTDNGSFERTVFGCEPVDATLKIGKQGDDVVMSLSSDQMAAFMSQRKGQDACTA
jgi:hypothetical protein